MDKISLEQLNEMFAGLRSETPWNVDGEMLWGFFFISATPEKLEAAGDALEEQGYHVEGIFKSEDEEMYVLQVERVETQTPESLHQRNEELEALAAKLEVEYDGMDVNPVPSADDYLEEEDEGADLEEVSDQEPIQNPDLLQAIEALKTNDSEEVHEDLTVELQCATYLVPYVDQLPGEQPAEGEESDDSVQLLVCADPEGAEFLPLFTDEESLLAWTKDQEVSAMVFTPSEAWDMVVSQDDCAGAVINPAGLALPIDRKLVEMLKQEADAAEEIEEDEK